MAPETRGVAALQALGLTPAAAPETPEALELFQAWAGAVSGKWVLPAMDVLAERPVRYNALLAALDPVAPKVLTQTLRRLEGAGLVSATAVGRFGRQYALTPTGETLRRLLLPLRAWARQVTEDERRERRLTACAAQPTTGDACSASSTR